MVKKMKEPTTLSQLPKNSKTYYEQSIKKGFI